MADVTISQLSEGIPAGNNILPYSTGSNTLGVPVSAIFQNTSNVGIGINNPVRRLEVNGAIKSYSAGGNLIFNSDSGYEWWTGSWNDSISYQVTRRKISDGVGTAHLTIDTSGNVSIPGKLTNSGVAKAWVNFDGTTGTTVAGEFRCAIRSQYNVSSVVRVSTGVYRINFATVMNNINYMTQYTGGYFPTQDVRVFHLINSDVPQTTSGVTVASVYFNGASTYNIDTDRGNVLVFGT